jgi:hypothetical protein
LWLGNRCCKWNKFFGYYEHSDNVPESKNKTDQNAFDVKAKDVGAEAKSMETTS